MGSVVIRKRHGDGSVPTSRLYQDAEEAERAAAAWRAEGQEVQVVTTHPRHLPGWMASLRRWLSPSHHV